ncbi:CGNR zinc finger domain-containing protein [Intrasporangium sp. YIM S08009]|uniref:CGNR zinc finger domain-containing protein n=1 Tax=Intrasporangium zincisolvens TaxID=3080018 RepID=UPI002B05E7D7|nr:CGNR zinc finger domain-containing protein [Intrasporangium sp. YIM S08009]
MFKYVVDDREMPTQVAGHPALELCNTSAGWDLPTARRGEYLTSYDDLAVWAREAGLVDEVATVRLRRAAAAHPSRARAILREVHRLRTDVHDLVLGGAGPAALGRVGSLAAEARQSQALERTAGVTRWVFTRDAGLHEPLYAAALSAADLLTSGATVTVSACPGDACGWVFLNPTGRRRWCIMAVCGNRAKARAYAERHASATPATP